MRILVGTAALVWLMTVARTVLLPLVVAVLVWFVLSAVSKKIVSLAPSAVRRGKTAARIVSVTGVLLLMVLVGVVVRDNVSTLVANMDLYRTNLDAIVASLSVQASPFRQLDFEAMVAQLDLRALALKLAGSGAAYLASLFTVLIYLIFVFTEADAFAAKLRGLSQSPEQHVRLQRSVSRIKASIDDFFSVTVTIGLVQAVPTFVILWLVGVDAPVLWAVLIFLFSFIPTIGTIFGIVFPVVMTALQFAAWEPTVIVLATLGTIQIASTNLLLPRLMSRSLNLSPLVVMFAVFAGAAIWGIVGALVAVPALTMALIVCMENPKLRWVAVLLSANGDVGHARVEEAEGALPRDTEERR